MRPSTALLTTFAAGMEQYGRSTLSRRLAKTGSSGNSIVVVHKYGQVVVNHLDFDRGRISLYFTENACVGVDLYHQEKRTIRFQADVANLGNTLELVDFGGLFSGNAIGPSRQYTFRLVTSC
jgi:hypothetical protein